MRWRSSDIFIVDFENISHLVLAFLFLTAGWGVTVVIILSGQRKKVIVKRAELYEKQDYFDKKRLRHK